MDIFDLFAKLTLDSSDYEKGLGQAQKDTGSFASKLKSGLATAAKVTATAMMAVGTAATATTVKLAKVAVSAYADYEQLVGGVETLFADAAGLVQSYAANAYKTAGLSANEYMETVTSFSASLLQSLGGDTERAANVADMAIQDMSDNANKMGTAMESIQTAYQGFAKQNYTMLDNLKLGYGGTKSEMERLILDAESLSDTFTASRDENGDLAMSYADIVDAIHIVQDEMGITGTTAKEASATIAGSVSAAKSAWRNLVAGLANENADMTLLIDNFVESVGTAGKNILPRVEKALQGVGKLVSTLGPIIAKSAPGLIKSVAPSMISAFSDAVIAIAEQLPEISTPILESLIAVALEAGGALAEQIPAIISSIVQTISDNAPTLISAATQTVLTLADGLLAQLPTIIQVGLQVLVSLARGIAENLPTLIPTIVDVVLQIVDILTEPSTLGTLVDASIAIIMALANGLIDALPKLIEKAPEIISNLVTALIENAPKLWKASLEIIKKLGEGIAKVWSIIKEKGPQLIEKLWEGIKSTFYSILSWGKEILKKIADGFSAAWDAIKDIGVNIVKGLWEGIKSMGKWIADKVGGFFGGIIDDAKSLLGIASPSKVFAQIGAFTAEGFGVGFDKAFYSVAADVEEKMGTLTNQAVNINGSGSGNGPIGDIMSLLTEIRDKDTVIVLEDGTLVGRIDKLLGQTAMRKARGNA